MIKLNPNSEKPYHLLSDVTQIQFHYLFSQGENPLFVVKTFSDVIDRLEKESRAVLITNLHFKLGSLGCRRQDI